MEKNTRQFMEKYIFTQLEGICMEKCDLFLKLCYSSQRGSKADKSCWTLCGMEKLTAIMFFGVAPNCLNF